VATSIHLSYGMWHGCLATGFFSFESSVLPAHLNHQYTWNFIRSSSHDKLYPPCHITKIQIFTFVDLAETYTFIHCIQATHFISSHCLGIKPLGIASYALYFSMCDSVTGNIW